jgi:hypothetical protein
MSKLAKPSDSQLIRLDAIVRNLRVGKHWHGPETTKDIVTASIEAASSILVGVPSKGEAIAEKLAGAYHVRFKEVRGEKDIAEIEQEYLRDKKEIGFGQLRLELEDPNVDALLFQRLHAVESDSDRWVAVLNLQRSEARAYWNRFHELSHRVAEPPQRLLPFRRERSVDTKDVVEVLMDAIAAELGFHKGYFGPMVCSAQSRRLTFGMIENLRVAFAPSASLLAVTNAVVSFWKFPAIAFTACVRGHRSKPSVDVALRVELQCRNEMARSAGLLVFDNMRVPKTSVVNQVFESQKPASDTERLANWETSSGKHLPDIRVLVAAVPIGDRVYCVMSQ